LVYDWILLWTQVAVIDAEERAPPPLAEDGRAESGRWRMLGQKSKINTG